MIIINNCRNLAGILCQGRQAYEWTSWSISFGNNFYYHRLLPFFFVFDFDNEEELLLRVLLSPFLSALKEVLLLSALDSFEIDILRSLLLEAEDLVPVLLYAKSFFSFLSFSSSFLFALSTPRLYTIALNSASILAFSSRALRSSAFLSLWRIVLMLLMDCSMA